MDKVSVITVCYNADKTIKNTIESVLQQSYTCYEYIVVDGASTDDTLNIVREYSDQFAHKQVQLKIISEKDHGIYDAMNKGIDLASGNWIIFMNADDSFYNEDALKNVFANNLNAYDVVYGDCVRIDSQGQYPMKANPPETLPKQMPFMHQAVFTRSSLCKRYKFNLDYILCADYDFFFKIYALGYQFKKLNVTVCNYSIRGISGRALIKAQNEVIAIKKNHNGQYPITIADQIQWCVDRIKMRIKIILPVNYMEKLRQIKYNR